MCIINFIDSYANTINVILAIVSIIISSYLTILIYKWQRKYDKEKQESEERIRLDKIREQARLFLSENFAEKEYLPLCMIASNVAKYKKLHRKIFREFNRCNKELQKEILELQNLKQLEFEDENWISNYLNKFGDLAKQYNLGKNLLFDNNKYFYNSFKYYSEKSIEHIDKFVFELYNFRADSVLRQADLILYIDRYLEFVLKDKEDTKSKSDKLPQKPPYNVLWEKFGLSNAPEPIMCFWTMESVISSLIAFQRHNLIKANDEEWGELTLENTLIETFEDFYFQVLLELYVSFTPTLKTE